jgi:sarcosine oxidase gamma subunit
MRKLLWLVLLLPVVASAQQVANQGQGSPSTVAPWRVTVTSPGGVATASGAILAPGVPTNVAVSTSSAAITGLTAKSTLRLICTVDVQYRVGTGAITAVTTDNDLPGRVIEYIALPTGMTSIAFVTTSGSGTCKVAVIPSA